MKKTPVILDTKTWFDIIRELKRQDVENPYPFEGFLVPKKLYRILKRASKFHESILRK